MSFYEFIKLINNRFPGSKNR